MSPDSRPETLAHIARVRELMAPIVEQLHRRAHDHDASKLSEPEVSVFDEFTPMLAQAAFGTPEYYATLERMKPALEHHYENNRHHPQFYPDGIDGMTLIDLVEMLVDWKASSERRPGDDLRRSFEVQRERFRISPQLLRILQNTALELGWIPLGDGARS